jgi:hypothetical protein
MRPSLPRAPHQAFRLHEAQPGTQKRGAESAQVALNVAEALRARKQLPLWNGEFEIHGADRFTLRDGKAVEGVAYFDPRPLIGGLGTS